MGFYLGGHWGGDTFIWGHTWAAPRILRWGTKQDSRAERAEKNLYPHFSKCGVPYKQANIYIYQRINEEEAGKELEAKDIW